jgi:2-phosphoglycerate kinase
MNKNILFYGVPGIGKTYITRKLSKKYNLPLIELDSLRKPLQIYSDLSSNPFLFYGTTEAYKAFGESTQGNIIKGLLSVRQAMETSVRELLSDINTRTIIEGAFLDPKYAIQYGEVLLLKQEDEQKHRQQFFENREDTEDNEKSFVVSRVLQDYLIKEASKYRVPQFSSMDLLKIQEYIQN